MHLILSRGKRRERAERDGWVNFVYTYKIKGWGVAKSLRGKRLRALSIKLAQQEADYTTKGIHFAHLACADSNKRPW